MKLLFVTKDWRHGIEKNTVYLSDALFEMTELTLWYEAGDIGDIVSKLPSRPDFILLNDMRPTRCPDLTGLDRVKIPLGIIMHDLNYRPAERKAFVIGNNIRYLFVHYRTHFYEAYPELKDRMIWFPHWVNTDVFKDYGLPKSCDYLMMGCIEPSIYPLRARMLEAMQPLPGFTYHPHPGYDRGTYSEEEFIVGRRYAKEINKAKLFLTDSGIYRYVFMKYYEVPACKTLLLAPQTPETADLGFIPDVNFIDITEENFLQKARYYAADFETLGRPIALRGYEMVRRTHDVKVRAAELVGHIERILGGGRV